MQIFNKSKRQFILSTGALAPENSVTVSDAEGAKLIEMYKDELIQIGNSKVEKENEALKAKLAAFESAADVQVKQNKRHK